MSEILSRTEERLGEMGRTVIGDEPTRVEATVGDPATSILAYMETNEIDLVVIATHGRTGFDRFLIGSVAERVLRQSPTPVLVVPPNRTSLVPTDETEAQD